MNSIFITGACGMVGSHMAEYYFSQGVKAAGTRFNPTIDCGEIAHAIDFHDCDVRDYQALLALLLQYKPGVIYHLAAQSYPTVSWEKPAETMDINANGTINVFEAVLAIKKTNQAYDPVVVVACSSAEYGASLIPEQIPIKEDCALLPLHPYGVSKVAQDLLAYQYYQGYGIKCIRARIFNTTGVRKVQDVVSDFTKRAVLVEKGRESVFRCGNLDTVRAIADVRDLVQALVLLSEKGTYGEAYNISGEKTYQVKVIIELIETYMQLKLPVQVDPALIRPTDEPIIFGDSTRLKEDTGWQQRVPITTTIADMIDYWRKKLA